MKQIYLSLILLLGITNLAQSQTVTSIVATPNNSNNTITVSFALNESTAGQAFNVSLWQKIDNGAYTQLTQGLSGNIGAG